MKNKNETITSKNIEVVKKDVQSKNLIHYNSYSWGEIFYYINDQKQKIYVQIYNK